MTNSNALIDQNPQYTIQGDSIYFEEWTFRMGSNNETDPNLVSISLPAGVVQLERDPDYDSVYIFYVVPQMTTSDEFPFGSNYYLTAFVPDRAEIAQPPVSLWKSRFGAIPFLTVVMPSVLDGGDPVDTPNILTVDYEAQGPQKDVLTPAGRIRAFLEANVPPGYEKLNTVDHADAFPVSLGRLDEHEGWYIDTGETL